MNADKPKVTSQDQGYVAGGISAFPIDMDGVDTFIQSSNDASSSLASSISWKSDQVRVKDGSKFPISNGILRIGYELIFYEHRDGNVFSGLARGFAGTSHSHHKMDNEVTAPCVADMFNASRDAILNLQRKIGLRSDEISGDDNATLWARVAYLQDKWFKPKSRFFSKNNIGHAPLGVQFIDMSIGEPVRWIWEFGDGSVSTDRSPYHEYTQPGIYDVSLTIYTASDIIESNGVGAVRKKGYVTVLFDHEINNILFYVRNLSLTSGAGGLTLQGKRPLKMLFVDQTRGAIKTRIWTFGDGTTATINDPHQYSIEHTYTKSGIFIPSLTVSDGLTTLRRNLDAQIEVTVG